MQPHSTTSPCFAHSLAYICILACLLAYYTTILIINSTSHYIGDVMLVVNPGGMVWLWVPDLVVCEHVACVLGAWRVRVVSTELE